MSERPLEPAVLDVRGLSVAAGSTGLVHELNFSVGAGQRVGLIGESGSGKSLTALAVMGLLPQGLSATGSVHLAGADGNLLELPERKLARLRGSRLSMIFQEPMTALNPTMRVGDQVAETLDLHARGPAQPASRDRSVALLGDVGLPDPAQAARAYPHQLSGGQRQRVMTAIALANDPALLICDEPTTALDVTVQALVLDLISRGVQAREAAMLFITHDLGVVATVCDHVLVMYGGRIVEAGPVTEVLTRPRHHYTAGLLAASDLHTDAHGRLQTIRGSVPAAGDFPVGCVFRTRCEAADAECEQVPPWSSEDITTGFACLHPRPDQERRAETEQTPPSGHPAAAGPPLIALHGVTRDFPRPRTRLWASRPSVAALRGVNLEIARGERFGIVGESGSGKSTLLRLIAGLDRPTSGVVEVDERDIGRLPERRLRFLREQVQVIFQDPMGSLDPRMRVRQIIAEPLVAQRLPHADQRISELLASVGLPAEAAHRFPHQFSGGQRQRISIARALAPDPKIILADEPVSALDVSVRSQVLNVILDQAERLGLTLVLVSHDLSVVRHMCQRVAVMKDGQVVEIGSTEQVYTDPQHPYTQSLVAAIPTVAQALGGRTSADLAAGVRGARA